MRILIYGAGVLGSYLSHALVRGGNDVTVLARGKRFDELKKDGIVIRHYFQLKTTVDKVNVISTLLPEDTYDLIFVVMQYQQSQEVLPIISDNMSKYIVFVGNNPNSHSFQDFLNRNSVDEKQVAFGFQASGGRRENGRIITVRAGGSMNIGVLDGEFAWRSLIENAFKNAKYKLNFNDNIDAWLKSHMIFVLVLAYVTNACNGNFRKVDRKLANQMVKGLDEGYGVLETLGYTITPANVANFVRNGRYKFLIYLLLKIYSVTPIPSLSDPMTMTNETIALTNAFDDLKQKQILQLQIGMRLKVKFSLKKILMSKIYYFTIHLLTYTLSSEG
jgi:2-dehydropantoate 2-reductase